MVAISRGSSVISDKGERAVITTGLVQGMLRQLAMTVAGTASSTANAIFVTARAGMGLAPGTATDVPMR
jgi:hypothetical protein